MKVLMLNGSAKPQGNTYRALYEVGEQLKKEGIDYEIFQIGAAPLRDCIGCGQCTEKGCVFDDDKVMSSLPRQRKQTDWYLEHLYTMLIQADVCSHSLTEYSTAAAVHLHSSRVHLWQLQDVAEHQHHSM